MKTYDNSTYLSVFTTRYGTEEMRTLFSDISTRKLWRQVWVALASVQNSYGLVSDEELQDIEKNKENIDIEAALSIEKEIRHDIMAEIKTYAAQCPIGGGKIHLGATSMDIRDNGEVLQQKYALELLLQQLKTIITLFLSLIETYNDVVCIGFTHIQPAEPTTYGYRFANYAQDFLEDYKQLQLFIKNIKGKGIKGAVGTGASYEGLLEEKGIALGEFEEKIMRQLGLPAWDLATQVYPRKQDFSLVSLLANIAQSASKFALDLRLLQSPVFGEMSEPFGKKQVGSSAMPFKRNPIVSERICSLSRQVAANVNTVWQNAAMNMLERTLDDSANRRIAIAQSFLIVSELLRLLEKRVLDGIVVNKEKIASNFDKYGIFAGTEPLLMALAKKGVSRQDGHELIRELSMEAWATMQKEDRNPLLSLLQNNEIVKKYFSPQEVEKLVNAEHHIGNVKEKCISFIQKCKKTLQ